VEAKCSRCKRVEFVDPDSAVVSLAVTMASSLEEKPIREVSFDELCNPCRQTVLNHIDQIAKAFRGKSPKRKRGAKKEEEVTVEVEIDESPPRTQGVSVKQR